jgi:hypothetical protein
MSGPDRDPTASIKLGSHIFSLPHSFSHSLLAVCECLLARFYFFSPSVVLLCITYHIPSIFFFQLTLFFSVSFKTIRIVIFWNVIESH